MSNPVINDYGDTWWFNDFHNYHREDGPAIEYFNGDKAWYINGEFIYRLYSDGRTFRGDMSDIPSAMKQSIVIETLKLQS